jgi:hypothetical protein
MGVALRMLRNGQELGHNGLRRGCKRDGDYTLVATSVFLKSSPLNNKG